MSHKTAKTIRKEVKKLRQDQVETIYNWWNYQLQKSFKDRLKLAWKLLRGRRKEK